MARETGIYRRSDSRYWWINATLPNGKRIRQSAGTECREDAEALLAKLRLDAYKELHFGIKSQRSWQEAVVRFLEVKSHLRDVKQYRGLCRQLHVYLGDMMLGQINGDTVWHIVQRESKRGVKVATINRHLAVMRAILRMAAMNGNGLMLSRR